VQKRITFEAKVGKGKTIVRDNLLVLDPSTLRHRVRFNSENERRKPPATKGVGVNADAFRPIVSETDQALPARQHAGSDACFPENYLGERHSSQGRTWTLVNGGFRS